MKVMGRITEARQLVETNRNKLTEEGYRVRLAAIERAVEESDHNNYAAAKRELSFATAGLPT